MRVIAGTRGGRGLRAPAGTGTRPTSDRVREAVFSMLGSVEGDRVLDLFAGSGALGIEALSRGAGEATFVESVPAVAAVIRANLRTLDLAGEVAVRPALAYVTAAAAAARQYDLVFADPPYRLASSVGPELSAALPSVLSPAGRVVTESDRRDPLEFDLPLVRERRYGDTVIRIHEAR